MTTYRFRRDTDKLLPQATLAADFPENAIYATSVSYGYKTPPSKVNVAYSKLESNIRITLDLTESVRRLVLAPDRTHDPADDEIIPTREEIIASYYKLCRDDPEFHWQTPKHITHFVACDVAPPEIEEDVISFICLSNSVQDVLSPFFEPTYSESDDESTESDDRLY